MEPKIYPLNTIFPKLSADLSGGIFVSACTLNKAQKKLFLSVMSPISAEQERELTTEICALYSFSGVEIIAPEAPRDDLHAPAEEAEISEQSAPVSPVPSPENIASPEKTLPTAKKNPVRRSSAPKDGAAATDEPNEFQPKVTDVLYDENKYRKAAPKVAGTVHDIDIARQPTAVVFGRVFDVQKKDTRRGNSRILTFAITDETDSVYVSKFFEEKEETKFFSKLGDGDWILVSGRLSLDHWRNNEVVINPRYIAKCKAPTTRLDKARNKRVELHLHTKMSATDAVIDVEALIDTAKKWGHRAIAITDHGVVHAYTDAIKAAKGSGVQVLYGIEGYYRNDVDSKCSVIGDFAEIPDKICVFDIETTGLSPENDAITEIAAVMLERGEIVAEFHTYSDPERPIPQKITELTGITQDTVAGQPKNADAVRSFLEFAGLSGDGATATVLAAHNATFDLGFIWRTAHGAGLAFDPVSIDTLALARAVYPEMNSHTLNLVADKMKVGGLNHHRALSDATATAHICFGLLEKTRENGCRSSAEINDYCVKFGKTLPHRNRNNHIIIFAKNQAGIKSLYQLISDSNLKYFSGSPIIYKSGLLAHRENLIIGSACEAGEVFGAVLNGSDFSARNLAKFYDYLEIQPIANNSFMLRRMTKSGQPMASSVDELYNLNRRVLAIGDSLQKPVCATCDAHFLNPEDEVYRKLLLLSKGYEDALAPMPIYLRTTDEMLDEFSYLGRDRAFEVVVKNTNAIADMIDPEIHPLPTDGKLCAPEIPQSAEKLTAIINENIRLQYGDAPPKEVTERVETELSSILGKKYDVIYYSAHKIVSKSLESGYYVGSRGSVGSSLAAYFAGITEVNALPAHYLCPECHHCDFESGLSYGCGADMPDKKCPVCGAPLKKEGFDIPFETFLGFGTGDDSKVPDIDLNFSGEYQAEAHRYTIELFGEKNVYRGGTITKIEENTARGYVKGYMEATGVLLRSCEEKRLAMGCSGVKKSTGQHPGGLVVVPADMDITDFCPVQHPADTPGSDIITTHFDYHPMEANLLKLDELGHDDPTMIKNLEDATGVLAKDIDLGDEKLISLFSGTDILGYTDDEIIGDVGTIGIPEFGTRFVRQMLKETRPDKLSTLIRLSGFSHGTNVWQDNARDLILNGTADISQTIGCRDDIMKHLISLGMDENRAFKIMERVRKGKHLDENDEDQMRALGVPEWYIDSCNLIAYLFPKAHAAAYVMMGVRIAWYKINYPLEFFSCYFHRHLDKFDAFKMTQGQAAVIAHISAYNSKPKRERTAKDDGEFTVLEAVYEFYKMGFTFGTVDIYKSDPTRFVVDRENNRLIPPLCAIGGLGEIAAYDIAEARQSHDFVSIDEFQVVCKKVTKKHIEELKKIGSFGDLPEFAQISLF
ncbi:MAG: PolC-type DNA polymerase III [Oscillospiraceae bacterium]|jgi:DNA polymerase-3 subunit alpha (Gram-positive type)|nr:PolC-type DNA polymerase III [Oscillospiraceae bacterium]